MPANEPASRFLNFGLDSGFRQNDKDKLLFKKQIEGGEKMDRIEIELKSAVSWYIVAKIATDSQKEAKTMKMIVERAVNFLDNGGSLDSLYKILENKN